MNSPILMAFAPRRLYRQAIGLLVGLLCASARSEEPPILANLSFEQLSQIQVITASKREQLAQNIPAAVKVLTGDEILRFGATSIPEVLRYVPGLNVAQINGTSWGIGARGFNAQFASKLLVMMDGRSIYTPVYGGVNWEVQDYLLEDLDRIEVVLGPGGSIWGANAMNGVINILSKSAKDTQGALVYSGGGDEKLAMAGGRVGGQLGSNTWGRVYVKYGATDDTRMSSGAPGDDGTQLGQAGFRLDGDLYEQSHWTLQGDGYRGQHDYRVNMPSLSAPPNYSVNSDRLTDVSGANGLGRWETEFDPDSTLRLQAYYDYVQRDGIMGNHTVHTADFELQHTWSGWERHQLDWGLGYRRIAFESSPGFVAFVPSEETSKLFNSFVQDEFALIRDRLSLTAGVKMEHNDFTGWEPQPNVRLTWHPAPRQTIWAAWSQPVRTPSLVEMNGQFDPRVLPPPNPISAALPVVFRGLGNDDLESEKLQAWELGWRWQAAERFGLEVNTFYYQYRDLLMLAPDGFQPQASPPAVIVRAPYTNGMDGSSCGGELAAVWDPLERWRLRASYGYIHMDLNPATADPFAFSKSSTPSHSAALLSSVKVSRSCDFDTALRFVDQVAINDIPSYVELDVRLAWRPRPNLELALVGQNLLHDQHPEAAPSPLGAPTEIQRSVYGKVTWKF